MNETEDDMDLVQDFIDVVTFMYVVSTSQEIKLYRQI